MPAAISSLPANTAVGRGVEAIDRLRDTAESHHRVFLVEVMGRHSGAIAMAVGVAGGAEAIVVPEWPTDVPRLATHLIGEWANRDREAALAHDVKEAGVGCILHNHARPGTVCLVLHGILHGLFLYRHCARQSLPLVNHNGARNVTSD